MKDKTRFKPQRPLPPTNNDDIMADNGAPHAVPGSNREVKSKELAAAAQSTDDFALLNAHLQEYWH